MTIEQFWNATPKEFQIQSSAFQLTSEQNFKYAGFVAWQTANLKRAKRLPPLQKFLEFKKKTQSVADQLAIVEALNIQFKGKDKRLKKGS